MGLKIIDFPDGYSSAALPSSIPVTGINVINKTLSVGEATAKLFTIPSAPVTPSTIVLDYNGIQQKPGIDYILSGTTIDFNGYSLDSLIEPGDEIVLTYS